MISNGKSCGKLLQFWYADNYRMTPHYVNVDCVTLHRVTKIRMTLHHVTIDHVTCNQARYSIETDISRLILLQTNSECHSSCAPDLY